MHDSQEFAGLVALVTGGAQGIGASTASMLMERGARVAVLDHACRDTPSGILTLDCDVRSTGAVQGAVDAVVQEFGALDIVVNNAGVGAQGDVAANDDEEWHRVLDINVRGMARVASAALPHLRRSSAAAIVNVASVAAQIGLPQRVLYSASKGAIAAMTLAMAADHVREGIRVNAVCPGTAHTPWIQRLLEQSGDPENELLQLEARQPHLRLVDPAEVAESICFLASPRNGSTTGLLLPVDGGLTSLRLRPASS